MAKIVGRYLEDDYYAGLWSKNMPQALLWSPYEEETFPHVPHVARRPDTYRAPTWSWASIESPISHFICRETVNKKPYAEFKNVQLEYKSADPYGQVVGGHLIIEGPLQRAISKEPMKTWPFQPELWGHHSSEDAVDESLGHSISDVAWPDGTEVWLLQITDHYGIVLQPMSDLDRGAFNRVGICHSKRSTFRKGDVVTIMIY